MWSCAVFIGIISHPFRGLSLGPAILRRHHSTSGRAYASRPTLRPLRVRGATIPMSAASRGQAKRPQGIRPAAGGVSGTTVKKGFRDDMLNTALERICLEPHIHPEETDPKKAVVGMPHRS